MSKYKEFIKEYDDGSLRFDSIKYRPGAPFSDKFALADGYRKMEDGSLEWGYVRIHSGIDRGAGREVDGIRNAIYSPFDFEYSEYWDLGGKSYGTLVVLRSLRYDFDIRIAHMFPNEILIRDQLVANLPVKRNTIIGSAGNYGLSGGLHTHTEVKSLGEKSEVCEDILRERFGSYAIEEEYSMEEILHYYRNTRHFSDSYAPSIRADWIAQKEKREVLFINKYLYRYIDYDDTKKTRYSTEYLWNGL